MSNEISSGNTGYSKDIESSCAEIRRLLTPEALDKPWSVFVQEADMNNDKDVSIEEFAIWTKNNANKGELVIKEFGNIDIANLPDENFIAIFKAISEDTGLSKYLTEGGKILNSVLLYMPKNSTINETLKFFDSCALLDKTNEGFFSKKIIEIVDAVDKKDFAEVTILVKKLLEEIGSLPATEEIQNAKQSFMKELKAILEQHVVNGQILSMLINNIVVPYLSDKINLTGNKNENGNQLMDALFNFAANNSENFNKFCNGELSSNEEINCIIEAFGDHTLMNAIRKNSGTFAASIASDYYSAHTNKNSPWYEKAFHGTVAGGIAILSAIVINGTTLVGEAGHSNALRKATGTDRVMECAERNDAYGAALYSVMLNK